MSDTSIQKAFLHKRETQPIIQTVRINRIEGGGGITIFNQSPIKQFKNIFEHFLNFKAGMVENKWLQTAMIKSFV
jgi:hypothetical protein